MHSSSNKYWSWGVHINQARRSQPSRLNSRIVLGITGKANDLSSPRPQSWKMWAWSSCTIPSPWEESLPEKGAYTKDAKQRDTGRSQFYHLRCWIKPRLRMSLSLDFPVKPIWMAFSRKQLRVLIEIFPMPLISRYYHLCSKTINGFLLPIG